MSRCLTAQTKRYGVYLWNNRMPKVLISNTDKQNVAFILAAKRYKHHKERVKITVYDLKVKKEIRLYYPNGMEAV